MTDFATADLYDAHGESLRVLEPGFQDFGGHLVFHGRVETVQALEDNTKVRERLSEPGSGGVLVIDGGGSMRCALVGDNIAQLAIDNGWAGIVVYGCIRDAAVIAEMAIGIKALGTNPRKSVKRDGGISGIDILIDNVPVRPGDYLYADADGIVVADSELG